MIAKFQSRMEVELRRSLEPIFNNDDEHVRDTELTTLSKRLFDQACVAFNQTAHMDSTSRFTEVFRPLIADLEAFLSMRRDKIQERGYGYGSGRTQSSMATFSIS
jgi:hypothetical protein